MSRRPTIKDIAALANTSVASVSLTLNNRPNRLSATTRARIIAAADQLHYVPNQNARRLVSNRSMMLGLIVPDIENVYFASLAKNLSDECNAHGYILVVANSNDSVDAERRLIDEFHSRGVDGIMLVPSLESFDVPQDLRLIVERLDVPVIILDRISALPWCDGAGFDNYLGGRLAAQHLLDHGHHEVGVIAARSTYMDKDGRITGFLDCMREAGSEVPPSRITEGEFRYQGGFDAVPALLEQNVTAVFCGNDLTAMGALSNIVEHGLKVPDDISLVGYDNDMVAYAMGIKLTTIDQDLVALSAAAIATIIGRIEEQSTSQTSDAVNRPWLKSPKRTLLKPTLIERSTVSHYSQIQVKSAGQPAG